MMVMPAKKKDHVADVVAEMFTIISSQPVDQF